QGLNSTEDFRQAIIGKAKFTDDKYTGWYKMLADCVQKGYFNDDVMSLNLDQGTQQFSQKKGAMCLCTDGTLKQAEIDLGAGKVGVTRPPKWGNGKLSDYGYA